jgi:hypothetical protein
VTDDAFETAIRAFTRRRRFRPFGIELHSGRVLRVSHPEAVRVRGGLARLIVAEDPERNFIFDASSVSVVFEVDPNAPAATQ